MTIQKVLIFDSGTLINLSMNGLLYILPELKKTSPVRFVITEQVKYEVVDRPIGVPRFELGALRINDLITENILELPEAFEVSSSEISSRTQKLMDIANHAVQAHGKFVKIVSDAEISCLALSSILSEQKIENLIAIDERTTRLLAEKPKNLQKLMSKKLHFNVSLDLKDFHHFKDFVFIRSTELAYVAHKKGVLHVRGPRALEAALYATKYKGSSVSFDEINVLRKM